MSSRSQFIPLGLYIYVLNFCLRFLSHARSLLLLKLTAKSLNLFYWEKPANAVIQLQYFTFNEKTQKIKSKEGSWANRPVSWFLTGFLRETSGIFFVLFKVFENSMSFSRSMPLFSYPAFHLPSGFIRSDTVKSQFL